MSKFANTTEVAVEKTRAEIEKTLQRYGAESFAYGYQGTTSTLGFQFKNRAIKFVLTLPDKTSEEFKYTPSLKYIRTEKDSYKAWEQACRSKWRALYLCIKAKLEAVDSGITTFDSEFLAHIVTNNGRTVMQEIESSKLLIGFNGQN